MDSSDDDKITYSPSGLPQVPPSESGPKYGPLLILTVAPLVVGVVVAHVVYTQGDKSAYDLRMLTAALNADMLWTCLAVVVLGRVVAFANCYPLAVKGCFLTKDDRQLWANSFLLTEIGPNCAKNVVVMDSEGDVGMYNRANRALQDMVQTCGVVLAALFLASTVFAFPAFAVSLAFCWGWVVHVVSFAMNYDSHGLGYLLATLAAATLEGMVALMALKIMWGF
ncbi:hypothetical protein DYB25_003530 [Aphanomyces astaci]|uniref:Uncharacterized protein n=1 Tax=Aphanomyces astaci TaxID=112090 RepID=A0A397BVW6_APHAT|nr:hypothetical protein DYB36_003036 [Aphanomyces astaci]RHY29363.1 hypothetical protein DYB25_003530 [Aphanomyces astaci]RHY36263.1 hypothetical protein DYB34_003778 [Aphanomyces astaci]RHY76465.1 hypothetical protein DYB38_014039 [Aphanomyces astaci]RHY77362.1 hypothetical protein DYB30_013988 [Aphanomyces astaci]